MSSDIQTVPASASVQTVTFVGDFSQAQAIEVVQLDNYDEMFVNHLDINSPVADAPGLGVIPDNHPSRQFPLAAQLRENARVAGGDLALEVIYPTGGRVQVRAASR